MGMLIFYAACILESVMSWYLCHWHGISFSDALIDSAVKLESDGDRNVLDSGCTCHEMEPMLTEVKEETDTDWEVKPTLSHTTGTTAFENGMLCFISSQITVHFSSSWLDV